jgi:uncharacterized membrane protein YhhN
MEEFLNKRIFTIYWTILLVHCCFLYWGLDYVAATKPLFVPLLLLFLLLKDRAIDKPFGKFIFYIGLFLAFFGDVLLIFINDTFFLSGMIAFMMTNLCYSISFSRLSPLRWKNSLPVFITLIMLAFVGYSLDSFLKAKMGDYRVPIIVYMCTVSLMIACAVNIAANNELRRLALRYFIPGAMIFLLENTLIALNRFHFNSDKHLYVAVMVTYALAQYLFVKGISKAYPSFETSEEHVW